MESNKAEEILNFYNGIGSFYNYLSYNLGDTRFSPDSINDKEHITSAKVALMALYFTTEKERLVKKTEDDSCSANEFSPKIIDEELANSIEKIATKVGDYYQIGDYIEKNPSNIIAIIRNKFAHGKYDIDFENNIIHFYHKKGTIDIPINIDDLFFLICQSVINISTYPKTNKATRIHAEHFNLGKFGFKPISSRKKARSFLKSASFKEYTFSTKDGSNIDKDALEGFQAYLNGIKKIAGDRETTNYITNLFHQVASKNGCQLNTNITRLSDEEIESVLDYVDSHKEFYSLDNLYFQAQHLLTLSVQKKMPNYESNPVLRGVIYNMHLLNGMESKKTFTFEELYEGHSFEMHSSTVECVVSSLLSTFNALYIYPLEDVYLNGTRYDETRDDQLDFSRFDFSFMNPEKVSIYSAPLDQCKILLDSKKKDVLKQAEKVKKSKENLAKAEAKNNQKGIEFCEQKLDDEEIKYYSLLGDLIIADTDYSMIKSDYDMNPDYFRNRGIIEGIRNAIAHGNVTINKFVNPKMIDDITMTFRDIYEGEVTFELEISIGDFEKLFNEDNIGVVSNFLNDKQKVYKINTCYKNDITSKK